MAHDSEALKARVRDISYTPGTDALRHISPLLLQAQDLTAAALVRLIGAEEDAAQLEESVADGCSPCTCRGEIAATQDDFGLAT